MLSAKNFSKETKISGISLFKKKKIDDLFKYNNMLYCKIDEYDICLDITNIKHCTCSCTNILCNHIYCVFLASQNDVYMNDIIELDKLLLNNDRDNLLYIIGKFITNTGNIDNIYEALTEINMDPQIRELVKDVKLKVIEIVDMYPSYNNEHDYFTDETIGLLYEEIDNINVKIIDIIKNKNIKDKNLCNLLIKYKNKLSTYDDCELFDDIIRILN